MPLNIISASVNRSLLIVDFSQQINKLQPFISRLFTVTYTLGDTEVTVRGTSEFANISAGTVTALLETSIPTGATVTFSYSPSSTYWIEDITKTKLDTLLGLSAVNLTNSGFIPKSIEDILYDISYSLEAYNSEINLDRDTLNDYNQGSKLKILARAFSRSISECWRALYEVEMDSNIATASGESLDLLVGSFNVSRKTGNYASGTILAMPKLASTIATVKTGDTFSYSGGLFQATEDRVLSGIATKIPVRCLSVGSFWNLAAGVYLTASKNDLSSAYNFVVGEYLNTSNKPVNGLTGGEDRETDDELRSRFGQFIQSLGKATYKAVYQAVLGVTGVKSVSIVENDPMVGFFSVYVDDGSTAYLISPALKERIETELLEWRACGVGVRIQLMEKLVGTLKLNIKVNPSFAPAQVAGEVKSAIIKQSAKYTIGETVYTSQFVDIAHNIEGVISAQVVTPTGVEIAVNKNQVYRLDSNSIEINATV